MIRNYQEKTTPQKIQQQTNKWEQEPLNTGSNRNKMSYSWKSWGSVNYNASQWGWSLRSKEHRGGRDLRGCDAVRGVQGVWRAPWEPAEGFRQPATWCSLFNNDLPGSLKENQIQKSRREMIRPRQKWGSGGEEWMDTGFGSWIGSTGWWTGCPGWGRERIQASCPVFWQVLFFCVLFLFFYSMKCIFATRRNKY